jgi:phosphatidylserine decarboxylase
MQKPSVGVALEGLPYIVIAAFTTLIFAIIGCWPVAVIGLAATAFIGHFFRDPERVGPEDADAVCSPADGRTRSRARCAR